MLAPLVARLTRSRLLARRLFGLDLSAPGEGERYFDATTVAMRRACRAHVRPGARVLEVGTGSFAVLALWQSRTLGCEVTSTEINPLIARRARESVQRLGASVRVVEGSFLAGLAGPFDVVLCNPPYVPTPTGEALKLPEHLRSRWDGGADGSETLAGFLAAFEREGGAALGLLGVNRRHVPRERVLGLIGNRPGLRLCGVEADAWLPIDVYRLVRSGSPGLGTPGPVE